MIANLKSTTEDEFDFRSFLSVISLLLFLSSKSYLVFTVLVLLSQVVRLDRLNQSLDMKPENKCPTLTRFKKILHLHDRLCDSLVLINKIFMFGFMLWLSISVFHTILVGFSVYNILANASSDRDQSYFLSGVFFICTEGIFIVCVFTCSILIKNKASQTFNLLHELKLDVGLDRFNLIDLAALQMEHRRSEISCGLFTVDLKFVFDIIAYTFSTVIVLVQFDIADSFKSLKS